jgi:hypothetical protein
LTYGLQDFQNLADSPEKEKSLSIGEGAERAKIHSLFGQYKKEMLYLRNLSERTLRGYQEVFNP